MTTYLTTTPPIAGLSYEVLVEGRIVSLKDKYRLGKHLPGTRITVRTIVQHDFQHQAYIYSDLGGQDLHREDRDPNPEPFASVYAKNTTVFGSNFIQIPTFPFNASFLEIHGTTFTAGIFRQEQELFFCVINNAETDPSIAGLAVGTVISVNMLQGVGKVYIGDGQIARIHWHAMPYRPELGFRGLVQGEQISFGSKDIGEHNGFSDIKKCTLAD